MLDWEVLGSVSRANIHWAVKVLAGLCLADARELDDPLSSGRAHHAVIQSRTHPNHEGRTRRGNDQGALGKNDTWDKSAFGGKYFEGCCRRPDKLRELDGGGS